MCDDGGVMWADTGLGLLPLREGVGVKGVRRVGEREARVNEGGQLVVMVNEEYLIW